MDFHFLCVLLCDIGFCNDLYMENCLPAACTYSLKGNYSRTIKHMHIEFYQKRWPYHSIICMEFIGCLSECRTCLWLYCCIVTNGTACSAVLSPVCFLSLSLSLSLSSELIAVEQFEPVVAYQLMMAQCGIQFHIQKKSVD